MPDDGRCVPTIDFASIYATELVYVPDCWRLCGNAHCCNFSRLKSRFRIIGASPAQELALLPGELDYLRDQDLLRQFGDHDIREVALPVGDRGWRLSSIISRRQGCACDHATRPAICRLYPMLPLVDIDGNLTGLDRLGMYDLLEEVEGEERICQIKAVAGAEMDKLRTITWAITASPAGLFALMAMKAAQDYLRKRLGALRGEGQSSIYTLFELALLRGRLLDRGELGTVLEDLAARVEARYGPIAWT